MTDIPLQLIAFGMLDIAAEPFCYGCAAFVLSWHFATRTSTKILAVVAATIVFLLMDDIWPKAAFDDARMAVASANSDVSAMLESHGDVGTADFASGESAPLFSTFGLSFVDIMSAGIFVPCGFVSGLLITGRRRDES